LGSDIIADKKTVIALIANNINSIKWRKLVNEFDGTSLEKIRRFLIKNNIINEVEELTSTYFSVAYKSLLNLGFNQNSEIYRFIKIIQGRHS
jgi:geranylgeranyl pyrophosphate synthase